MSIRTTTAKAFAFALLAAPLAAPAFAQDPMVGGAPMSPSKTIVENASQASNLTTLVAAVKAAGLVDALSGPGPLTVFAPTNEAFNALPPGTVDHLVQPENKPELVKILTYHVVAGRYSAHDLIRMVRKGGGQAELKTLQGEPLTVVRDGAGVDVRDAKGGVAHVTTADVFQSNGVVHVIDKVLLP